MTLEDAKHQPFWRRPVALLFLMALAMPIAFNTWSALLNNFVIEVAGFDGSDIGLLHTVREIPGFLAVGVIAIILYEREQVLGFVSLVLIALPLVAEAQTVSIPNAFINGSVADANAMNENFVSLGESVSVTVPNTFVNGTPADADEVNANFQALKTGAETCLANAAAAAMILA